MKLRILITICFFGAFFPAYSQQIKVRKISVHYVEVPLKTVIEELANLTGNNFSYSSTNIPVDFKITYQATHKNVNQVFNEIFTQAGITYKNVGGYLVLKPLISEKITEPKPKKFTISGYLVDAKNQEALIGAAIYDSASSQGTTTNNYGFFSLTLPAGNYELKTSYMGYQVTRRRVALSHNITWNISLKSIASVMQEILVSSFDKAELLFVSLAAQTDIQPFKVARQTAALGETDMLKSLDNLPGISFQSDGSSYFYVRGGNRDQNLILLDEATIYNPSHMFGLFTPIIPDAVKNTQIYKADFPIQYGGRLSSVVDIRTRDGNMERWSGSGSLGLVSGRFTLEGPLKKGSSSVFTSFRRSHLGVFIKAINPDVKDFYFSDFTSKFNIYLGKKDRLFLTFYHGKDVLLLQDQMANNMNGLQWDNVSFTARWNHLFGEKTFVNTTFYTSKYDYLLHTDYENQYYWNSHISSGHLKSEFTYFISPENKLFYGLKLGRYYFNPGNYNGLDIARNFVVSPINSGETILYAGNEYYINDKLLLNSGLRISLWQNYGAGFVVRYQDYQPVDTTMYKKNERYFSALALEPRLSVSYKMGEFSSVKASYNRTIQHINLISNSISPFNSLEVWLPSGPNIKPQKADIFNLGFLKSWDTKTVDFTADVFYKKMYNQVGYAYHAYTLLNPFLDGEIRQGNGKAYGFELSLRKTGGRLTGQIGYSFTRSLLKIDDLNGGREYFARQDKPIDFNFGISLLAKPRWLLTLNFMYASGARITTPTGFYNYRGTQVPVYTTQNNNRLPDYKRIDIGTDIKLNKNEGNFEHHLSISVYNFFNTHNPGFLYFNKTTDDSGNLVVPADKLNRRPLVTTQRFLYTFVPSLTYNLKF